MVRLTANLWIGDRDDADALNCEDEDDAITGVLCAASDMRLGVGWPALEVMHVGLVDGPGNPMAAYVAAVLALRTLLGRHERVLVCCHGGRSRSLAVVLMHLALKAGRGRAPTEAHRWRPWREVLSDLRANTGEELPEPHEALCADIDVAPLALMEAILC